MKFYPIFLLLWLMPLQADAFYKCTDDSGAVTYQKMRCSQATTQSKMHVYIPPKPDAVLGGEFRDDESGSSDSGAAIAIQDKLGTILSSLSPIKTAVTGYISSMGKWPKKLSDVGMDENEMTSSYVDAVSLDSNGKIVTRLNRGFGERKQLIIEPKSVMGGTSYEWKCYANFPRKLLLSGKTSMCESRTID